MAAARPRTALLLATLLLATTAGTGVVGAAEKTENAPKGGAPQGDGRVAMTVEPSETLIVPGGGSQSLRLTNSGGQTTEYFVSVGNFDVAANGTVRIDPPLTPGRSAKRWLRAEPERVTLKVGQSASIRVRATPSRFALTGDHGAILLFVTAPTKQGQLRFRGRIGVPIIVRVAGPLVRKLRVGRVTAVRSGRSRVVKVRLSNLGNVSERFTRDRMTFEVRRGKRLLARLRAGTRLILPGTSGVIAARYRGPARGPVTVRVKITPTPPQQAGPGIASAPRPIVRTATVRF